MLAASGFKTTIAETAQSNGTLGSSAMAMTVSQTGKVSGGSITNNGIVTILGNASTVGTLVTIILTPSINPTDGKVIWACTTGNVSVYKFVPAECRH